MQFLTITKDMTLSELSAIVGDRNVDYVLNTNGIKRSVNIWVSFSKNVTQATESSTVDYLKKFSLLNQFVGDSDLFEKAALGTDSDWQMLALYNCFSDAIFIPEDIVLPSAVGVLGNGETVPYTIYKACETSLLGESHDIPPEIFAEYNTSYSGTSYGVTTTAPSVEPFEWFKLPLFSKEVALYSSLSPDEMIYFPVYPQELSDGASANFDEMGEMLYQYEPWKVYKSSGPREMTFTFEFHRDMWSGDHRDGAANAMVRACQANCYPEYNGSLVNVAIVTLYIHEQNYITGVMTDCKINWKGPIGLDGFYLMGELSFTITEISPQALNYTTVKNKGLIQ